MGEPNSSPSHPDYVPSVFPSVYKQKRLRSSSAKLHRYNRRMSRGNAPMTSSSNDGMNSVTSSADHGMDTSDIPLTSSANESQTAIADQASLPESSQVENRAYIPDSDTAKMDVAHALLELS